MSARIFIKPGTLAIPQADFNAQRQDDNGAWTATQSFQIVKGALNSAVTRSYFAINKSITELDPDAASVWSFLRVRSIGTSVVSGGWEFVTVNFGGFPGVDGNGNAIADQNEFQVTYSMRGQTGDSPLSEHWKFKALDPEERTALAQIAAGQIIYGPDWLDPDGYVCIKADTGEHITPDPITSSDGIEFATKLSQGINSFRSAGYTWSKRWAGSTTLTGFDLSLLGKITSPPGSPPTPPGERDWLLVSANIEQTGEINANPSFTNEVVFELSEEGKWDSFLYSA